MAITKAFSLYDHICAFKSKEDFKATRLAQYPIQVLSRDACLIKWEASSLYQILVGARARYDETHGSRRSREVLCLLWLARPLLNSISFPDRALFDLAVALDKEHELFI
ncbi:hypothetical protein MPER_12399 [Moniliophthora perniciosa FA553]|nr:hypothetical protein MPER_12399 [Moniliophthora perniciosa FA553]